MKNQPKKTWQQPGLILISSKYDIKGGGTKVATFESHDGNRSHVSTHVHGGVNTVGTGTYQNAHS